jgi:hypothetical protein
VVDANGALVMLAQQGSAKRVPVYRKNMQRYSVTPQLAARSALGFAETVLREYERRVEQARATVDERKRLVEAYP